MLSWIENNSSTLNVLINFVMLIVWATYLHLILMAYLRQRRPRILINRGAGRGINGRCLVSNMSADSIYVQSILFTLRSHSREWTAAVTDVEELSQDQGSAREFTNQGPLGAGEFFDIGTFRDLGNRAVKHSQAPSPNLEEDYASMEVMVVAAYGSEKHSVAARRQFKMDREGHFGPTTVGTEQINSFWSRRKIEQTLRKYL